MTTLPRWALRVRSLPSEPRSVKSGAVRGGSKTPALSVASSARTTGTASTAISSQAAKDAYISELDHGRLRGARKALVHVRLVGHRVLERAGGHGELHQLLEFAPDHAQVAVGHPVGRVLHDEAQDVRVL